MKIRKYLACLLLVIISLSSMSVFAAPSAADTAAAESFMGDILGAAPSETDLADRSLAMLFGTFIFTPFGGYPGGGEESTALAQVLGYSNIVAMILGVIILSYNVFGGAIKTAADGELLGKGWSSIWLPLRTMSAFGLITPVSDGSGVFSVAQSLVIWMVIVGSNSGTWVWEKGAEILTVGSPAIPTTMVYDFNAYRNVVQVLHCSVVRHQYISDKGVSNPEVGKLRYANGTTATSKSFNYGGGFSLNFSDLTKLEGIAFTDCGDITFPSNSSLDGTLSEKTLVHNIFNTQPWEDVIKSNFESSVPTAYLAFLNDVLGKVKTLSDGPSRAEIEAALTNYSTSAKDKAIYNQLTSNAAILNEIASSYKAYIATAKSRIVSPDIASQWKSSMTEGGWMAAGAWFFEASRLQSTVYNYLNALTTGASYNAQAQNYVSGCGFLSFTSCSDAIKDQESKLQRIEALAKLSNSSSSAKSTNGVSELSAGASGVLDASFFKSASRAIATSFMSNLMDFGGESSVGSSIGLQSGMTTNTSGMISPFTAISSMGRGLQSINEVIWLIGLVASGFAGAAGNTGIPLASIIGGGAAGVLHYLVATLVPLMGALLGMSFVMAMAIPFMPVVTWIMMACGYLLTIIEAVAAAPLAVIMMATPEGDGIAGQNMQRALQMINSIILRPTLSIVGLFAAMTLSYVGFSLMNTLFWKVAGLNTTMGLYEIIGLITIYISMSLKMCEYMISVMYKIPDHILDWMGGGMTRDFGEKGAAADVSNSLGKGSNLNGDALKAIQTVGQRKRQQAERKFWDDMAKKQAEEAGGGGDTA